MSTTTGFFRNDLQTEVLLRLKPALETVYVFGCSDGCEVYSLAIWCHLAAPAPKVQITGFDIDRACLAQAQAAVYTAAQLDYYNSGKPLCSRKASFFDVSTPGCFLVNKTITQHCAFRHGDVLDARFVAALPPADAVLCQNVLVHLAEEDNRRALENLCRLLGPDGLLLLGGMRPPVRSRLTYEMGLEPIADELEKIHDGWLDLRRAWDSAPAWRRKYYYLEPFQHVPDAPFRYGTIFRKGE
jgi:chemotaxis methyl-accepting protein methylase